MPPKRKSTGRASDARKNRQMLNGKEIIEFDADGDLILLLTYSQQPQTWGLEDVAADDGANAGKEIQMRVSSKA